jgi:hypothetical protein
MASGTADDGVDVHAGDEGAGGAGVGQGDGLAGGVFDRDGVLGRGARGGGEFVREGEGLERGGFNFGDGGIVCGHGRWVFLVSFLRLESPCF